MFERILVAYDGRTPSQTALKSAIEIAARFQSALTIATVLPGPAGSADPQLASLLPVGDDERPLGTLIEENRAHAKAKGVRTTEVVFLKGEPTEAIVEYLARSPHDLLVVGTRELRRAHRLLLGSVSSSLLNAAPCPVLVVRPVRRHS